MATRHVKQALAVTFLALSAHGAKAWDSPAPDVVLYCTPTLQNILSQVAARYTESSHVEVHLFVSAPSGVVGLIERRARDDVVVADATSIATLAAGGLLRPNSIIALGSDPFVLISKAGAPHPPNAGAAQLVAAYQTVLPDPTTAATFDGAAILHAALPDVTAQHLIGVANTPTVIDLVRDDAQLLGVVNATEVPSDVARTATLSAPPLLLSGALAMNGQSGNAAALLGFIAGPVGKEMLRAAGLEIRS